MSDKIKNKKHYAIVLGARPNFVKAAPLLAHAREHPEFTFTLIHTGQHYDEKMSAAFFREFKLPVPDIQLNIQGTYHTEKIGKMFAALHRIFTEHSFDGVIVFGDVNSSLAGAIAAAKKKDLRLIHIEAGLRSHDRRMPEEINRVIIDHLSSLLFTTEQSADENLTLEGVDNAIIHRVGNLMIEAYELFKPEVSNSRILTKLSLIPRSYVTVTLHRQENTDDQKTLHALLSMLLQIQSSIPVVLPLHPGTKVKIESYGFTDLLSPFRIIEPLGYFDFQKLITESAGVITDSGGIQEETTHLGIPCATLRDNTERPITLELGSNKLFPPVRDIDAVEVLKHLRRTDFKKHPIPLWDNSVSERILSLL